MHVSIKSFMINTIIMQEFLSSKIKDVNFDLDRNVIESIILYGDIG